MESGLKATLDKRVYAIGYRGGKGAIIRGSSSLTQEKKKSHHTVDITLTNDRSLLNFVFFTGPIQLASIGEHSTSAAA